MSNPKSMKLWITSLRKDCICELDGSRTYAIWKVLLGPMESQMFNQNTQIWLLSSSLVGTKNCALITTHCQTLQHCPTPPSTHTHTTITSQVPKHHITTSLQWVVKTSCDLLIKVVLTGISPTTPLHPRDHQSTHLTLHRGSPLVPLI